MANTYTYCLDLFRYKRRKTRIVPIGVVPLGGDYPIRIQSMTTTPTMNTHATVEQTIQIIEAGGEYVRITAPSIREAENLKHIKDELRKRGYNQPLIADIHYTPKAAETAARIVEKVRINPGNYADKKHSKMYEYTDDEYIRELNRIYERFSPLVKICKEYGTAMRIGSNHGSLSDRILSRYGDTPLGMVESALEFVRICEDLQYYNIVLSMKSSNPIVMVEAYRLLVNKMDTEGMQYPLHLGVTEAGEGEEGRVKSAVGIGALLEDGLGDTIRISLTEPPENEIPPARRMIKRYINRQVQLISDFPCKSPINPFVYSRRETCRTGVFGGNEPPRVIADFCTKPVTIPELALFGILFSEGMWVISDTAPDFIYIGNNTVNVPLPEGIGIICDYQSLSQHKNRGNIYPHISISELPDDTSSCDGITLITVKLSECDVKKCTGLQNAVLVLDGESSSATAEFRAVFFQLIEAGITVPVIIKKDYTGLDNEDFLLYSAADIGGLLVDGLVDGVWLTPTSPKVNRTVFNILQAGRARISKTEYISCPGCGRTLFNLQETSTRIRERTAHLKGVKIAIMGCIVNGPGEMADADYGYVGTGKKKISLYRGKKIIKSSIPEESAVDELISLIQEDGKWVEHVTPLYNTENIQ